MNDPVWDIDGIVREVLQRLEQPPVAVRAEPPVEVPPATRASNSRGTLRLTERVITLATLDGRLRHVRRLLVQRSAVMTPSVRDLLRQRNIAVDRVAPETADKGGSASLIALIAESDFEPRTLETLIGAPVERLANVPSAVQQLVRGLREHHVPSVLLTERAALAVCLANRHSRVRAVWGASREAVHDAVRSIGANLLIVDPRGQSAEDLAALVVEFSRCGSRECPAEYVHLLEATVEPPNT